VTADTASVTVGRTALMAAAALCATVLPVFLVAALSPEMQRTLGIDEVAIGAAFTAVFVTAGFAATPAGRFADRRGAGVALRSGLGVVILASVTVGLVVRSVWQLVLSMMLVGVSIALVDTGGARLFADRVPEGSQGRSFGIKEASVPTASLLAGLTVPAVAVWIDWRVAFLIATAVPVGLMTVVPSRRPAPASEFRVPSAEASAASPPSNPVSSPDPRRPSPAQHEPSLALIAIAVGVAAAAANAAATFFVPSLLARGLAPAVAGVVLSVASLASIATRLGSGRWVDRTARDPRVAVAWLTVIGAVAAVGVAIGGPAVVVVGAVLTLGAGWGWTGLAFMVAIRARRGAPARAAGLVLTGLALGGAFGPLGFGALAAGRSYSLAWGAVASGLALAALLLFAAGTGMRPPRTTSP
jgi:predicted MFS family arabinose efflux permease